tara:strand:+ start:1647 stop:1886 length:240 start_codon:yes stop_codon:yes gene_type:complete
MANFSSSDMNLTGITTDFNFDDADRWQAATTASFVVLPGNPIPPYKILGGIDMSISKNTRRGWVRGKRPVKGAVYPRGG